MATIHSWAGSITEIGPLYPFVGSEFVLVAIVAAFWIAWHVLQLKVEDAEFRAEAEKLRQGDAMKHVLDREG